MRYTPLTSRELKLSLFALSTSLKSEMQFVSHTLALELAMLILHDHLNDLYIVIRCIRLQFSN